jgi:Kdo2-lipid IVA lauroyltransferase/acyltransferase
LPADPPRISVSRQIRYRIETTAFFTVIGFFRLFNIDRASAIGGWIGRKIIGRTLLSRRAARNLRQSFPEKSEAELAAILDEMWDNLGRVMAEYAHLDEICWRGPDPRITVGGVENFRAAISRGKGMIAFSGHLANWEIMAIAAREYGTTGGLVVRHANNPHVSRWLDALRSRIGLPEQISKGAQGTRRIFTLLRRGETILLLADQRASEGIRVPFFGRDAFTTSAPASLALKLGAAIVPVSNRRVAGARFHMQVYPAIEMPNSGDHDQDVVLLTAAITRFIEDRVRECPGQWLWIHKRWVKENAPLRKRALAQTGTPMPISE